MADRGVAFLNQKHYRLPAEQQPGDLWFSLDEIPVSGNHPHSCSCPGGATGQEEERGRPFCHQRNLFGVRNLLGELLETQEISDESSADDWFSLVEQPWSYARDAAQRGDTATALLPSGDPVQVLDRDLYLHVDAARVKNVPLKWGRSVTVIKLRLSGMRRGTNQLRPLAQSSTLAQQIQNG